MNEFEIIGYEEISEDELEDHINHKTLASAILYHLLTKKDWKLIRRIK